MQSHHACYEYAFAVSAPGSVERLLPELTGRSGPPAGGPPGMSPAGQSGQLIGLYLESRQLHFRVAVHESSHRRTHSPSAVFTCLRTARAG